MGTTKELKLSSCAKLWADTIKIQKKKSLKNRLNKLELKAMLYRSKLAILKF